MNVRRSGSEYLDLSRLRDKAQAQSETCRECNQDSETSRHARDKIKDDDRGYWDQASQNDADDRNNGEKACVRVLSDLRLGL